MLLMFNLLGKW